MKHKVHLNI